MEDAYPIGINSTFSKWSTPCSPSYGDCGCDNCQGGVQDVARRLDHLAQYEIWLGLWPKTKAHNPQSFHGEGYWSRDPTEEEAVAMSALALNHGAKAIASWVWPTSPALAQVHGRFARAVANEPVRSMVTERRANRVRVEGAESVDVAYWTVEDGQQVLVTVVNGGPEPVNGLVTVPLPAPVVPWTKDSVIWGNGTWTLGDDKVQLAGVAAMSTNMVLLRAGGDWHEI